jgi:hypothetical protein
MFVSKVRSIPALWDTVWCSTAGKFRLYTQILDSRDRGLIFPAISDEEKGFHDIDLVTLWHCVGFAVPGQAEDIRVGISGIENRKHLDRDSIDDLQDALQVRHSLRRAGDEDDAPGVNLAHEVLQGGLESRLENFLTVRQCISNKVS